MANSLDKLDSDSDTYTKSLIRKPQDKRPMKCLKCRRTFNTIPSVRICGTCYRHTVRGVPII